MGVYLTNALTGWNPPKGPKQKLVFPEMEEVEALVVRDFYHRYTVDEHTLVTIETALQLRALKEDPFGDLASETEDPDTAADTDVIQQA